jgi:hypothetical protein
MYVLYDIITQLFRSSCSQCPHYNVRSSIFDNLCKILICTVEPITAFYFEIFVCFVLDFEKVII